MAAAHQVAERVVAVRGRPPGDALLADLRARCPGLHRSIREAATLTAQTVLRMGAGTGASAVASQMLIAAVLSAYLACERANAGDHPAEERTPEGRPQEARPADPAPAGDPPDDDRVTAAVGQARDRIELVLDVGAESPGRVLFKELEARCPALADSVGRLAHAAAEALIEDLVSPRRIDQVLSFMMVAVYTTYLSCRPDGSPAA